ncbi:MAG: helix-turn-helix domain-containing protein [Opitutaceae bacterium]
MKKRPRRLAACLFNSSRLSRDMLKGICTVAQQEDIEVAVLENHLRMSRAYLQGLGVDGILAQLFSAEILDDLKGSGIPLYHLGSGLPDKHLPVVRSDNKEVGRLAARFFLQRGFQHFGFFSRDAHRGGRERLAGFQEALAKAGRTCFVCEGSVVEIAGNPRCIERIEKQLRDTPKPSAILVWQDGMYDLILNSCQRLGFAVPRDLSILGVNDDIRPIVPHRPALSSVRLNGFEIGCQGTLRLLGSLRNEKPRPEELLVPPLLIMERQSTNSFAVADPMIRRACDWMRAHLEQPMEVGELARHLGGSRRQLERRFDAVISCSPYSAFLNLRMDRAKELLLDTSLKIETIAQCTGFGDAPHFSSTFKRRFGESPAAFRKRSGAGILPDAF